MNTLPEDDRRPGEAEPERALPPRQRRSPPVVPFETIALGSEEVWIELDAQIYRLRRTRQGKLILTK